MLSKTLSIIFKVAFVFTLVFCVLKISGDILLRPVSSHLFGSGISVGEPGLDISVQRTNLLERPAPDTVTTGVFPENAVIVPGAVKERQVTSIMEDINHFYPADSIHHVDANGTQTMIKNVIKKDLFASIVERSQQEQILRIYPKTVAQHFFFTLIDLLTYGCAALIFLALARLFQNFSNHLFFTHPNIRMLRQSGIYFLLPQLGLIIFYFVYHSPFTAFKVIQTGDGYNVPAQYSLYSSASWTWVMIGLACLVLSYIFKNGLELKEEQDQYV